jgi:Zn-dependent peptidase ImmA (M78 family)
MHMMDLSLYKLKHSYESMITSKYQSFGIHNVFELDIKHIAHSFRGEIDSTPGKSHVRWDDQSQFFVIFFNRYLSEEERRFHFFHELAHPLLHVDKQTGKMPRNFTALQEYQAKTFQMYAAMPFYLLKEYQNVHPADLVRVLSEDFILPERLVNERLSHIQRQIYTAHFQQEMKKQDERLYPKADPNKISDETRRMLDKLHKQLAEKHMRGAAVHG